MSNNSEHNPVGFTVEAYDILGKESADNKWVGADLELVIRPVGRFMLNVVTKEHFANQHLQEALDEIEQLAKMLDDDTTRNRRTPFVLNDDEINYEILERKFRDRKVEEDLAASLLYDGPTE